ncbi:cell division protein FtsK [Burkholderiaceae bacterium 16]|nr:cell division protein FtsK [Burkholderiaceae bacterium 16]
MSHSPEFKNTLNMTAGTLGKDLLSALVLELKMLPDTWVKLPQKKQDDILDRLRNRVDASVKMAVHLIASQGRTVVTGDLDKLTIKDGVQAVIKIGKSAPGLHDLSDAQGQAVLLVIGGGAEFTEGMDEVRGESDQRAFDLGKEYTDGDGDGMPEGDAAADDDNVVDAEYTETPLAIEQQPLQEELEAAHEAGHRAASEGKPESDCPKLAGALCIAWVKGWKRWHAEQAGPDPLYDQVVAHVVETQQVSITKIQRHFKVGYNRAARLIEQMEADGVVSAQDLEGHRNVLKTTEETE